MEVICIDRTWWKIHVVACLVGLAAAAGCDRKEPAPTDTTSSPSPVRTPSAASAVRLGQGWNAQEAEEFYYTPQGSQLIPYAWFLALEVKDRETLFRDNSHMAQLGYITASPDSGRNPDGLPVGFVQDAGTEPLLTSANDIGSPSRPPSTGPAGRTGGSTKWLGITCAACHTGELRHGAETFRIDGGPAMADHESFAGELALSLEATHRDDAKFTRFAQRVLGASDNSAAASTLRADLKAYTDSFKQAVARNTAPHRYGFARLDAFGAILNQITEVALGIPGNHGASDAPVSFPFLWGAPALDWVQWNGSVDNPLARNVGEVMGVYGNFTLDPVPPEKQFTSSVNLRNLHRMEEQLSRLSAPQWPEQHFGAIDRAKADAGRQLYERTCKNCHFVRDSSGSFPMTEPNKFGKQFVRTVMISASVIGTDPTMVKNFGRLVDPGVLRPLLPQELRDAPKVPAAAAVGHGGSRGDPACPRGSAAPGHTRRASRNDGIPRSSGPAAQPGGIQGPSTRRCLGDRTLFAQRFGAEPLPACSCPRKIGPGPFTSGVANSIPSMSGSPRSRPPEVSSFALKVRTASRSQGIPTRATKA